MGEVVRIWFLPNRC